MSRRRRYAELSSRRSHRHPPHGFDGLQGQLKPWPPERLPLPFCSRQSGLYAFADPLALELGQCTQDVQLQPTRWRGEINAFA